MLDGLEILDTPPEAEFETIIACAQRLFGTKIALLSLVGEDRQWFKARRGLAACETPRTQSFCAHAIRDGGLLVVPDATRDPRFADNPLVLGEPNIRFYAGVPIHARDPVDPRTAYAMGTVCIIDDHPRTLSAEEATLLGELGQLAESLLSARALAARAIAIADARGAALQRLDITHRQFRQAERMADIGSWRLTLADNCAEWSEQIYAIHGLPPGVKPALDDALAFYPPAARAQVVDGLARTIATGDPFALETDFITAQGNVRRIRSMGELEVRDGQPVAVIGVMQDITARYRMEQQLRHSARRDDLTGLANRAYFNEVLDDALGAARREGTRLALALIDLDHFKAVNDTQGHLAGDAVLRQVATCLGADYLAGTFAARLGGDEFVLLITRDAALRDLAGLLERLVGDMRTLGAEGCGGCTVSATIGAAWLDCDVRDRSDLLHRADLALYDAKRACRGTVHVYRRGAA
ncbi:sensor domain-containing diguanylate cyclase [Sphingomonas glacialis]|uniref:Sensor domain-containing diguanylate cyclase n=1 Tax=Sphingomonas glacialis TaxID=658225 RepID=A0A502G0V6_9SPHN|nr:sensor domain-containing diguanylate cyclase [Sphingomonas glacialis]